MKLRIAALLPVILVAASGLTADPVFCAENGEAGILYWVAPMDPNYRRDEPGKSPMGMDLVPVYADAAGDAGTVRIDSGMVQNLGVCIARVECGKLWR